MVSGVESLVIPAFPHNTKEEELLIGDTDSDLQVWRQMALFTNNCFFFNSLFIQAKNKQYACFHLVPGYHISNMSLLSTHKRPFLQETLT